jgi:hypothetical protein
VLKQRKWSKTGISLRRKGYSILGRRYSSREKRQKLDFLCVKIEIGACRRTTAQRKLPKVGFSLRRKKIYMGE